MSLRSCHLASYVVMLLLYTCATVEVSKANKLRKMIPLNAGWQFLNEESVDVEGLNRNGLQWQTVNLPHTWNRDDVLDINPGYKRGIGWYRKHVVIPLADRGKRFILYFEGVNMKCDVFVDGRRAGNHVGGYIGFEIDITPFMTPGKRNLILVKADNGIDPNLIPSQKSDFFLYGGITRNVWLKVVPQRYISSARISTPAVSREESSTSLQVELKNAEARTAKGEILAVIKNSQGAEVSGVAQPVELKAGRVAVTLELPAVNNPELWSPERPALYTAEVRLRVGGEDVDRWSDRFGYRWFEFKEHGPFYLNGERLLLRGTHRHEEWSGLGNALPDSLHRREIELIKGMGANFVRLGHYPQAPEVYRACDELGLLVWDELPWCRGGMGGEEWKNNTRRLLEEMILQNYNRPSIIVWSLGNELDWLPDFPGGDNMDSLRAMLTELNTIAHRLDPWRKTATRRFSEAADLVDLHSPSIWMGWYSASFGYKNYETAIEAARMKFKRFFHAEYGGDSHVGRHTEERIGGNGTLPTKDGEIKMLPVAGLGDWSESYMVDLFDWHLMVSEQLDSLTGNAQWIFKDFGTPLRPENPIPYVNQKGLCDIAGNPKDAYYVFKSYWTTSPKFSYIESPTWTERYGPPGVKRQVKVFSNCSDVELFLNGTSQGRRKKDIKQFPASGLSWQVDFVEGSNTMVVVGFEGGMNSSFDTLVVKYTYSEHGAADDIRLSAKPLANGNILVTAIAVDKNGRHCINYNKRVYFSLNGSGSLLAGYGTPTRSNVIEMANGKAQIEVRPHPKRGSTIEVRNQDLKGSYLYLSAGSGNN